MHKRPNAGAAGGSSSSSSSGTNGASARQRVRLVKAASAAQAAPVLEDDISDEDDSEHARAAHVHGDHDDDSRSRDAIVRARDNRRIEHDDGGDDGHSERDFEHSNSAGASATAASDSATHSAGNSMLSAHSMVSATARASSARAAAGRAPAAAGAQAAAAASSNGGASASDSGSSSGTAGVWAIDDAPDREADLCVHVKKVRELENVLKAALVAGGPRLVVLAGPPGVGKSTALQVLARKLGVELQEWVASVGTVGAFRDRSGARHADNAGGDDDGDNDFYDGGAPAGGGGGGGGFGFGAFATSLMSYESPMSSLEAFLHEAVRFAPVANGRAGRVVVLDDLPLRSTNAMQERFSAALRSAVGMDRAPVVLILSGAEDSTYLVRSTVPLELRNSPRTAVVTFNPVSDTAMRKALLSVCRRRACSAASVHAIAEMSNGDMRLAINQLQLSAGREARLEPRASAASAPSLFTKRASRLELGHAVKRVLFWTAKADKARTVAELDVGEVVESADASPTAFLAALQENAIDRFSSIEEYAATCDDLSDADMLQRWHDSSVDQTALLCSLQVAGQSVLLRNTTPAASKFSACRMTQWSQLSRAQSWQIDVRQAMARVALVWPSLRTALADAMLEIVPTARWLTRMRDPSQALCTLAAPDGVMIMGEVTVATGVDPADDIEDSQQ